MKKVKVTTDYNYENGNDAIRIKIGRVEQTSMVEIYISNKLAYYKPISDEEAESPTDQDLVYKIIQSLPSDKDRWLTPKCQWLHDFFDSAEYINRATSYRFNFNDIESEMNLVVIEDANRHVKLHVQNEYGNGKIVCDFDVKTGENVVFTAEDYSKALLRMVEVFKANLPELNKATLSKTMYIQ